MMDLADDLLARTTELDLNEERVLEDLMRGLLNLRRRKINQEIEFRKYAFEDLKEQDDSAATQQSQYMVQLAKALLLIDRARAKYTSRAQMMRQ
jgi:hypothetical protein